MPFINLIQEQRLVAVKGERRARICFFTFIGSCVAVFVTWTGMAFQADRMRAEQARLRGEIQRQTPIISQINLNVKEAAILEPKVKTLEDGQKITDKWVRILSHLTVQTPKQTWLTGVRSVRVDEENPTTLTIQGMSPSQEPVAELILRLQNEKDLDGVNPKTTHAKDFNGRPFVEFDIIAHITGTAKPKPVKKDEGEKKS